MNAPLNVAEPDLGFKPKGLYYGGQWVAELLSYTCVKNVNMRW